MKKKLIHRMTWYVWGDEGDEYSTPRKPKSLASTRKWQDKFLRGRPQFLYYDASKRVYIIKAIFSVLAATQYSSNFAALLKLISRFGIYSSKHIWSLLFQKSAVQLLIYVLGHDTHWHHNRSARRWRHRCRLRRYCQRHEQSIAHQRRTCVGRCKIWTVWNTQTYEATCGYERSGDGVKGKKSKFF